MAVAIKNITLVHQRLVSPENTQDSSEESASWLNLNTLRAEIIPAGKGSEIYSQNELQPIQSFRFRVFYVTGVRGGDRLVDRYDGTIYHVTGSKNKAGRRATTIIEAREWQS